MPASIRGSCNKVSTCCVYTCTAYIWPCFAGRHYQISRFSAERRYQVSRFSAEQRSGSVLRDVRYRIAGKAKNAASYPSIRMRCACNCKLRNGRSVLLDAMHSFILLRNGTQQQPIQPPWAIATLSLHLQPISFTNTIKGPV